MVDQDASSARQECRKERRGGRGGKVNREGLLSSKKGTHLVGQPGKSIQMGRPGGYPQGSDLVLGGTASRPQQSHA